METIMCDQRHNKHTGDEEEDDIEFLRLAALKSLQIKKEPLQYNNNERLSNNFKLHNETAAGNSLYSSNRNEPQYIPTQHQKSHNSYNNQVEEFFPNSQRPYRQPINQNNLDAKKLNEPYVPRSLSTGTTNQPALHLAYNTWITDSTISNPHIRHGYHPTVPYSNILPAKNAHESLSNNNVPNVQLSPRSLAFVEQNNDILARRKGGNLSPNNYNRSPRRSKSPDYRRIESLNYKSQQSPNYSFNSSPVYRQSPTNYSPDFYKTTSPRRWSVSPQNYKKVLSRSRSPQPQSTQILRQRSPGFNRKRTVSRSPKHSASRSPLPTKRTRSRSPPITINQNTKIRCSPISIVRRYSRSPIQTNERHGRKISRSPKGNISRHCSPYVSRYNINKNKSPNYNKKRLPNVDSVNDTRQNRSRSPNQSSNNNLLLQNPNKKYNKRKSSASPSNQHHQMNRKRSRSPKHLSPLHKYIRRSKDRNFGGHNNDQDKNHNKRSPINKKRRGGEANGVSRNRGNNVRYNSRRSQSPSAGQDNFYNRKRRSKSRHLDKPKRFDNKDNFDRRRNDRNGPTDYKKRENHFEKDVAEKQHYNFSKNENDKNFKNDGKFKIKDDNENLNIQIAEINEISRNDVTSLTPPLRNNDQRFKISEKTNLHKNIDEKSNETYNNCNDNGNNLKNTICENDDDKDDDDDDDDGIDLFPSDDSESETEGRFKSTSNRNERKTNVPTLSFAKLNSSHVPEVIKDLQDVCSNKNSRNDHRFDRRRDDKSKKNDNLRYSRNEKRRYNDIKNRKNSRSRSADRKNKNEISGKIDKRDIDTDDKRKSMFKSTFQAIDEGNKINTKLNLKAERASSLGKSNNIDNIKKRFKESEDSLENFNMQQLMPSSLKRFTPPIINMEKYNGQSTDNISKRSTTPTIIMNNEDSNVMVINGKKSIHSRLGAMTNTFKSATKPSTWTKNSTSGSSSTPPLLSSSFSDKV